MKFNTTIVVVNNEELSPQEELVQDIVSILHVFSCRLYGLRKYKNKQRGTRKLLKSFKTEIHPTEEQKVRIHKTIGTCRFIYNFYLAHNKELYQNGEKFMSSSKFRVWLNHEYLPQYPEYLWIKEAYSKAVTQAVNHGQTAFKNSSIMKVLFRSSKRKADLM